MNESTKEKIKAIKNRSFGVEVEMYNIRRRTAAYTLGELWGTSDTVEDYGGSYNKWIVEDKQGRRWSFMSDSSIEGDGYGGCEMVTPILQYEDIELLQEAVRELRRHGAKSDPYNDCGVHVHVSVADLNAKHLLNLTNIVASHEEIIKDAISVTSERRRWCKATNPNFLKEVNRVKPRSLDEFKSIFYRSQGFDTDEAYVHYSDTRYYLLNFHSLWQGKGIEFRCFQFDNPTGDRRGGLHAGELKSYIQLSLALVEMAKSVNGAKSIPSRAQADNPQYSMRRFIRKLGLKGAEFKTVRDVMFRNLEGNARIRRTDRVSETA